ncbi:hypothetical protein KFL_005270115 [Klebsormidium nitens]|uniref:Uncharacterized protein n=1 Tax=Klebsormidium nitens TaxID=105231 RepID=A0A1Y1IEZ6_KLENI|nr:hypothetical protein KFL_005270115 [Klebsormidium nitens]|eukprot:GAQ89480.1 hypothetical protein KFL_005270115 [Klebsormidium nitens]
MAANGPLVSDPGATSGAPPNYHEDWLSLRIPNEEMMYFDLDAPPRALTNEQRQQREQRITESELYLDVGPEKEPIVYHPGYNVSFGILDPLLAILHPFDSVKYRRIHDFLLAWGVVHKDQIVQPKEATQSDLLVVHTPAYLARLCWSYRVAQILEILPAALLPKFVVQARILRPFRTQSRRGAPSWLASWR